MTALDRIRLTGLLRRSPASAGLFYFDVRFGGPVYVRRRLGGRSQLTVGDLGLYAHKISEPPTEANGPARGHRQFE